MILLIKIILAHILGDFFLQPKSWIKDKQSKKIKSWKLYKHIIIHGLLTLLLLRGIHYWPLVICISLSHFCIDLSKIYFQKETTQLQWFLADQLAHITAITGIWYAWSTPDLTLISTLKYNHLLIYFTAFCLLSQPTAIIIKYVMTDWSANLPNEEEQSLPDGGKYIGILERSLVFIFIAMGHWEAIGFLLTAKSVFRFGDLQKAKNRKLTEYILLGTLLSFGIAIFTSIIVNHLISNL